MKQISLFLAISFLLISCGDKVNNPSDNEKNSDPFGILSGNSDGYLFSSIFRGYDLEGITYSEYSKLDYYFYDSLGNVVSPNQIEINNDTISKYKNTPLPYDGSNYSWDVTGNLDISTFNYSVNGIVNSSLISPIPDTTVINKLNGITINYSLFSGTNNVVVYIKDNAFLSKRNLDTSIVMSNEIFNNYYTTSNTGQFTITPSMLSHITGNRYIDVSIIGYNIVDTTFNSRKYRIVNGAGIDLTYEVN